MREIRLQLQAYLFATTPNRSLRQLCGQPQAHSGMLGHYFQEDIDYEFLIINNSMRLLALLVFALLFAGAVHQWAMPPLVGALYVVASLACFAMYAVDKAAAKAGRWRTSENTLLMLGLACGWPGAVVAQQLLRHKSNKPSFKGRFWFTVVLNMSLFAYLASPVSMLHRV